jgi:hypothetical protein
MSDMNLTADEEDNTNLPDVTQESASEEAAPQPLYRVYRGSKIVVGKAVGPAWRNVLDAAEKAYAPIWQVWDEVFAYYNADQSSQKTLETPSMGTFKRGDGTENMVYSNLNVTLPAIYSKDPNFTCTATDDEDEDFGKCMQTVINQLFRRQDKINAKPRIKRNAGFALLTNFGVLKLGWTKKDDSRELAQQELSRIMNAMATATKGDDLDRLYGQLEALEANMELYKPGGAELGNVLPQNLIIDPYAEQNDGLDGNFMAEKVMLKTNYLNEHFTEPNPEDAQGARVLTYKPSHKAVFQEGQGGDRDDGLGMVLDAVNPDTDVTRHTLDERSAYMNLFYTACYYIWDRPTQRVYLFAADDFTWPIWVWDAKDLLNITRFFPYFITAFGFSTGGIVSVGETAYVLDQQDQINDINRKVTRIRRSLFDFWYYNSDKINKDEAEKFVKGLRGESRDGQHCLGVKAGENKIADLFEAVKPPALEYEALFNKDILMQAMNRVTNTNDALRGQQFKAYTNQDAVETYQESLRLSIGAKVDVIEDTTADIGLALAELCVQNMEVNEVKQLVGKKLAESWQQMPPEQFRASYNLEIVAGSMEKPNSVFKKKEAIQVAQGLGQFAQAAPGATLTIMLKVIQDAFTDVVIKPEDWALLRQEVNASMRQGDSTTGAQGAQGGQPQDPNQIKQLFASLPPAMQQKVVQMHQQGVPAAQIVAQVQQMMGGGQQQQQSGGQPAQAA